MVEVRISPRALGQLREVQAYIAGSGAPNAAAPLADRILEAIAHLAHAPLIGRPVTGAIRELTTVPPYVIRYRVRADVVEVYRIRHGARRPTA